MNNILLVILSVIAGTLLGIVSNVVANLIQPSLGQRIKLTVSLFVGLITCVAGLTILSNEAGRPTPSTLPTAIVSGEILYYEKGNWILKNLSDGSSRSIPLPTANVNSFTWSPDGQRILFAWRESNQGKVALYVFSMETFTMSPYLSLPDLDLVEPAWSPDGTLITFCASHNTNISDRDGALYTLDPKTNQIKRITNFEESAYHPAWSPDSAHIAFQATLPSGTSPRIFVIDRNGNNRIQLTDATSGGDRQPSWTYNGKQIAYLSFHDNLDEVWTIEPDTGEKQRITYTPSNRWPARPLWSPDDKWIAYHSNQESEKLDGFGDIYVTSPDRSVLYRVTSSHAIWFNLFQWRP